MRAAGQQDVSTAHVLATWSSSQTLHLDDSHVFRGGGSQDKGTFWWAEIHCDWASLTTTGPRTCTSPKSLEISTLVKGEMTQSLQGLMVW